MEVQWAGSCGDGFCSPLSPTVPAPGKGPASFSAWTNVRAHWAGWSRGVLGPVVEGLGPSWGLFSTVMSLLSPDSPGLGRAGYEWVPERAQAGLDWALGLDRHGGVGTWAGPGWL